METGVHQSDLTIKMNILFEQYVCGQSRWGLVCWDCLLIFLSARRWNILILLLSKLNWTVPRRTSIRMAPLIPKLDLRCRWVEMSTTGLFTARNEPRYLLNISLGGPNAGLGLCKRDKAPASTGIRIPDRTGHTLAYRSITLYRLPIV